MDDLTPEDWLKRGDSCPYDAPKNWDEVTPVEPMDWATRAARGLIRNLSGRGGFDMAFDTVESYETREEIVREAANIVRTAHQRATAFPLDERVMFIMGRPPWVLAPIAHRLRELGHQIDTKCEDEQAYAIHWLLHLYFDHGAKWREEVNKILNSLPEPRA